MAASLAATFGVLRAGTAPASATPTVTDSTTPGSFPWGTAFDGNGRVWVALPGCDLAPSCPGSTPPGQLALFDPASHTWVRTVSLPSGYGQPLFVAVAPGGKVWFTMPVTNSIGVYDPVTGNVQQWQAPSGNSGPWDLAIDHRGVIWFTEHYSNKIASFDPSTTNFQEVTTPALNSNPYGITVDGPGNIWFTENTDAVALIAEYTTGGTLNEYKVRNTQTAGTGLTPHLITIDQSGNPWWSEGFVGAIGMLDLANAQPGTNNGVTEFHYTPSCGNCGTHTSGIATDGRGNVWFDDSLQNTFGSMSIDGCSGFSLYNAPRSHPHDGLNVDAQNRVWFDEEFGNALAEVVPDGGVQPCRPQVGSGVVVDGWGGVHPFSVGGAPAPNGPFVQAPYWPGWDIVRGDALVPGGSGNPSPGGYMLDGLGGVHAFGMENNAPPPPVHGAPYWPDWDIARGVALMPNGGAMPRGGFVLDGFGLLHWFTIGSNTTPAPTIDYGPGTYTPNRDLARGVFILPDGSGGYVVDAFGGLHPFSIDNAAMPSSTVGGGASWPGWDIARGAALGAATNGLLLDGFGGLHPFWFGSSSITSSNITGAPYWPGWSIARAIGM
ncbi:MAG: hypothetical protein JOZ99_00100 [Actinobacteria bacterium]|nr:hypothetical protein [Actinomycetota bacterium]